MAKYLITGAGGLVGANLCKRLISDGHKVFSCNRSNRNVVSGTHHFTFDLLDKVQTAKLIKKIKPDYIYHLAAQPAEARGQIAPIDMTERNINIFLHVLVPAINVKVKRFIFMSSVSVYGDAEVPYTEDEIPNPKNIYGINKYACEQMLKVLGKVNNLDYTIFRAHNMYGPYQDMRNPYKNVVALFMRSIMEDKPITIYGGGKMRRAFSYIDDVVDVLAAAVGKDFVNQIVNVGSSVEYSIEQLAEKIEKIAGKRFILNKRPARPQEVFLFISNNRKLRLLHEYKETPLDVGLKKTWDFINLPDILKEDNEIHT